MPDDRGPITLITSISDQRNRWKALAYAWKNVALQAVDACSQCGAPALWRDEAKQTFWCEDHWKTAPRHEADSAEKAPWYVGLIKAMDLEDQL
jgi:hypothetical protein